MRLLFIISFYLIFSSSLWAELTINFVISVDWEGDTLKNKNLKAMQDFNRRFPEIVITQLLNPAYFTKSWAKGNEAEVAKKIHSVLKDHDDFGIHIHAWENFVKASGVEYHNTPSYIYGGDSPGRGGERGDDIAFNSYRKEEQVKMLKKAIAILEEHGFGPLTSFRAGGWQAGSSTYEALGHIGLSIETSGISPQVPGELYPNTLLEKNVQKLWPGITSTTQPFNIEVDGKTIWQFPSNGGAIDYFNEQRLFQTFKENVDWALANGKQEVDFHVLFHQETAQKYLPRLKKLIRQMNRYAKKKSIRINSTGLTKRQQALQTQGCLSTSLKSLF